MSSEDGLTLSKITINFFGVIILVLGLVITYFSIQADIGLIDPGIFTPLGVLIILAGGVMTAAWEG